MNVRNLKEHRKTLADLAGKIHEHVATAHRMSDADEARGLKNLTREMSAFCSAVNADGDGDAVSMSRQAVEDFYTRDLVGGAR